MFNEVYLLVKAFVLFPESSLIFNGFRTSTECFSYILYGVLKCSQSLQSKANNKQRQKSAKKSLFLLAKDLRRRWSNRKKIFWKIFTILNILPTKAKQNKTKEQQHEQKTPFPSVFCHRYAHTCKILLCELIGKIMKNPEKFPFIRYSISKRW